MTIKANLEKYNLFDQAIIRHGVLECIRDYELIGYLSGAEYDLEVQYIFKGCIKVNYALNIASKNFSMDDRLLDLDSQEDPNYPKGFVWGAKHAVVYPGWILKQSSDELKRLGKDYNIKFYKIYFNTNAYKLSLIFHDLEIKVLKKIKK